MSWAERVADIEDFRLLAVMEQAGLLQAAGREVFHLEAGEPDFPVARPVLEAARAALEGEQQECLGYLPAGGLPALRAAIAAHYGERYGLDVSADRVLVTPGASGALLLVLALLAGPGRGVLVADPGYPSYRQFARLLEAPVRLVPVSGVASYCLEAGLVRAHWGSAGAVVLVGSPANPTGAQYGRNALRDLYEEVQRRGGALVVDEIYHGLHDGKPPATVLEFGGEQGFAVGGFSKYYGMTGWRLGWLVAPAAAVPQLLKLARHLFISAPALAQHTALACFLPQTRRILERRRLEFRRRLDYLLGELPRLGFELPVVPRGAFYVYARLPAGCPDSETFCRELLAERGVAVAPGTDFGRQEAHRHLRFACTLPLARLRLAMARLAEFLGR